MVLKRYGYCIYNSFLHTSPDIILSASEIPDGIIMKLDFYVNYMSVKYLLRFTARS